jgi:P27 family predicted phage terminase small subunit
MRGRKPKPTKLKKLAGNPGKRPLNAHEARIEPGIPTRPAHLCREAMAKWKEMAQALYELGLLTKIDGGALALYCQAYGRWVQAEKKVTKHGMIGYTAHGTETKSVYERVAQERGEALRKMSIEFGLTPSSRSRVSAAEMEQMSLADLLFQKTKTSA